MTGTEEAGNSSHAAISLVKKATVSFTCDPGEQHASVPPSQTSITPHPASPSAARVWLLTTRPGLIQASNVKLCDANSEKNPSVSKNDVPSKYADAGPGEVGEEALSTRELEELNASLHWLFGTSKSYSALWSSSVTLSKRYSAMRNSFMGLESLRCFPCTSSRKYFGTAVRNRRTLSINPVYAAHGSSPHQPPPPNVNGETPPPSPMEYAASSSDPLSTRSM